MKPLTCFILTAALSLAVNARADYMEDFDSFTPLGTLQDQGPPINWEAHSLVSVVTSGSGRALKSTSYSDKWCRHDATGVDLDLALDQDGIEYGFDIKEDSSTLFSMRMHMREGRTANYSPAFGLNQGVMCIRPNGEQGDTIYGNNFSSGDIYGAGTPGDPG